MKNLTNFRKTVETGVDPRLPQLLICRQISSQQGQVLGILEDVKDLFMYRR